jgi:L-rhamnose isomerase/sugar isomerase
MRPIAQDLIDAHNEALRRHVLDDYEHLGEQLARRHIDIERVREQVAAFGVAIPSWGVGTGGTRFARFAGPGEPRHVFDKLQDCAVIHQLGRATPTVSLHIPWDKCSDYRELREAAAAAGLGFDAMNSNTFSDQPGQPHSYKFGSLTHTDAAVRAQAVAHNLECIEIGRQLGSKALTVWVGDGSNFPGQQHFRRAFDRYIDSTRRIVAGLPADWRMFLEHKIAEPAFYSTVIQDWGSSYLAASALGPKVQCLVDLGHHAPNVNIELIVARLIAAGKLAGFHFNDSKYGDDDLDAGSVAPYRLFLVFNELVAAAHEGVANFNPAYMLDQSHNVTDPIESLIDSAEQVQRTCAQALLVDREALDAAQQANDALAATRLLKRAFQTDVSPIVQRVRLDAGAAAEPIAAYRASGYRARVASQRPARGSGGGGIV